MEKKEKGERKAKGGEGRGNTREEGWGEERNDCYLGQNGLKWRGSEIFSKKKNTIQQRTKLDQTHILASTGKTDSSGVGGSKCKRGPVSKMARQCYFVDLVY